MYHIHHQKASGKLLTSFMYTQHVDEVERMFFPIEGNAGGVNGTVEIVGGSFLFFGIIMSVSSAEEQTAESMPNNLALLMLYRFCFLNVIPA